MVKTSQQEKTIVVSNDVHNEVQIKSCETLLKSVIDNPALCNEQRLRFIQEFASDAERNPGKFTNATNVVASHETIREQSVSASTERLKEVYWTDFEGRVRRTWW